jgi:alpha-tubulin suppressor-like RCC1 family protein
VSYEPREAECGLIFICYRSVAKLSLPSLKQISYISFIHIGLGDGAPSEIKKPRKPSIFDIGNVIPARSIVSIICGGMHSVALASNGAVYTWGCNDEGALGRVGAENTPILVDGLKEPTTNISGGDSHTIAYNTQTNKIFYWGCYRVSKLIPFYNL